MKKIDAPLSKVTEAVLATAHRFAEQYKMSHVGTDSLLLALAYSPGTAARRLLTDGYNLTDHDVLASTLSELPFDKEYADGIIKNGLSSSFIAKREFLPTPRLTQIIDNAKALLAESDAKLISTDLLLRGLCQAKDGVGLKALIRLGINPAELWKKAAESKMLDSYIDKSSGNESQLIITLDDQKLSVAHYAPLGLYRVPLLSGDFAILKPGRNTPKGFFTKDQIGELEEMINNQNVSENDLQKFFESNPEFLKLHKHSHIYPQIQLKADEDNILIPDFFLRGAKEYADVCDIKLPSSRIVAGSHNRRRFSAAVFEGVAQLRNYRNYFDDPAKRKHFYEMYGLNCYKPNLFLVIGRSKDFNSFIERRDCELDFSDVEVLTYDDLLKTAKERTLADLS